MQVRGTDDYRVLDNYVLIAQPEPDKPIGVEYPARKQEITLSHRTRDIRAVLEGDAVIAMDNFGADLTFFDSLD